VHLAQPLLRVAAFVREIAAGSTGAPPRAAGTREVAELTEDVARMAADLEEKQAPSPPRWSAIAGCSRGLRTPSSPPTPKRDASSK